MYIMVNKVLNQLIHNTCGNSCMFDWSRKNGNQSGKSQGILISCVSGNPVVLIYDILICHICFVHNMIQTIWYF